MYNWTNSARVVTGSCLFYFILTLQIYSFDVHIKDI